MFVTKLNGRLYNQTRHEPYVPAEILPFSTPRWVTIPENLIASCPLSRWWNWMELEKRIQMSLVMVLMRIQQDLEEGFSAITL